MNDYIYYSIILENSIVESINTTHWFIELQKEEIVLYDNIILLIYKDNIKEQENNTNDINKRLMEMK